MPNRKNYNFIYTHEYTFPYYLRHAIERNIGRMPLWTFPPISDLEELSFIPLRFDNRHHLLEMFANDANENVDVRFKDHESLYEYVAMIKISSPYSPKHGGTDWLVFAGDDCVGILHAFEFNREKIGYQPRRCEIGYAFVESVRGTGLPQRAVTHLIDYLFATMDLLYVFAHVELTNQRSIRFLKQLEFAPETGYEAIKDWTIHRRQTRICLERFRSKQARWRILKYRKETSERNANWRAKWVDNGDGSFTLPSASNL